MWVLIVGGFGALLTLHQEEFPNIDAKVIQISVPYLGAAPIEVEQGVCIRIEEAIQGIDGIKRMSSTASEGTGTVLIELELAADARKVVDEIKSNVDAIVTFPEAVSYTHLPLPTSDLV